MLRKFNFLTIPEQFIETLANLVTRQPEFNPMKTVISNKWKLFYVYSTSYACIKIEKYYVLLCI